MPVYTYRCPKCKVVDERLVDFKDRDEQLCGAGVIRPGSQEISLCGTEMVRDEVELTQRTPGKWG